jgi:hypothetical protein
MGHRINERNTGDWSVNSEPKKRGKKEPLPELTSQQEIALNLYLMLTNLLKSHKGNYYSYIRYDTTIPLIKNWVDENIVTKGIRKSKIKGIEDIEICHLNPEKQSELEAVAKALIEKFNLNQYI